MAVLSSPSPDEDPWNRQDCKHRRVSVVVDNGDDEPTVSIPVTSAEISLVRDGVADIQRIAQVTFPSEWNGTSVVEAIQQFDAESQSGYSKARMYLKEPLSGLWFLVHVGFVRGVGPTNKTGESKMWVDSIANLIANTAFSGTYNDVRAVDLLNGVRDLIREQSVFEDLIVSAPEHVTIDAARASEAGFDRTAFGPAAGFYLALLGEDPGGEADAVAFSESFDPSRDTVADVLRRIKNENGGQWYFEFQEDATPVLVYEQNVEQRPFVSTNVDGADGAPVKILENSVIEEISPYNTVTVFGSSGTTVGGFTIKELETENFPVAVATHEPLRNRTQSKIQPRVRERGVTTERAARNVAVDELVDVLSSSGQGDMTMYGRPDIRIGDSIMARPMCETEMPNSSVPNPVTYEVESVTHKTEGGKELKTNVNVSVWVDRDDITVESYTREKNQGS